MTDIPVILSLCLMHITPKTNAMHNFMTLEKKIVERAICAKKKEIV